MDGSMLISDESGSDIIDRLTIQWLLSRLASEEREIMQLWVVDGLTFAEIGKVVGHKYRGRELSGSAIKYHKDRIIEKLQKYREAVGK